jgi:hypothetical protein
MKFFRHNIIIKNSFKSYNFNNELRNMLKLEGLFVGGDGQTNRRTQISNL